jgi:hypothetical protein
LHVTEAPVEAPVRLGPATANIASVAIAVASAVVPPTMRGVLRKWNSRLPGSMRSGE